MIASLVEAGLVEAGSVEAGSVEAGSVEAGSVEAGSVEAGSVEGLAPSKAYRKQKEMYCPAPDPPSEGRIQIGGGRMGWGYSV
ncbi:unnamed protein product [Boreogadus saida]